MQGLSFSVSAGSHYAFVGKNGAGKSTVIKLLMGLYRDYEGEILIDGKELREYPVEELRKLYAVIILQHATNGIGHSVIPALKLKLDREALVKLERKVRDVPAEWFEHREFLDFLEKAYKGTGYCFALLVPMLRFLFKYGPYCVLMGLYLKRYDPVLALCVVLIFIPAFASMVIRPDLIFELEDHAVLARRMDAYLKKCVGGPEYFKETRTLGISGYFKTKFLENVKLLNGYIWKAQKKIKLVELMTTLFSVFGYGGVMVLLVVSLLRGRITTALYASVFSSITLMYAMCDDAAYHFLSPFDGVAIVNSFVALIKGKLPERKDRPVDFSKPIVAEDITFSYPGTDKPALDHVSFRVRAGETIAIVGNNGSGKTTLSKILLGIYTPKSGSVKIGDVDIGEISSKSVGVGI